MHAQYYLIYNHINNHMYISNVCSYNDSAKQRVIRMVEAQVDPMEPPKHKFKKVPRGPPSPPVPVLHSPPRKLTVQDQQAWKIPPCISNWKNARGYTIPLDKRLAADGRGLQEVTINNKFASLSETLYIAERKAAEDLRIRNTLRKQMAMKEKEDKEKDLREMANKARQERAGVLAKGNAPSQEEPSYYQRTEPDRNEDLGNDRRARRDSGSESSGRRSRSSSSASSASSDDRGDERGRGDDHSDNELDNARHRERSKDRSRYDDNRRRSRSGDRGESRRDNYGRDQPQDMQMESEEDRQARYQREKLRIERRKERERELRLENMKVSY
jgi:SNW domain-containing protein 1